MNISNPDYMYTKLDQSLRGLRKLECFTNNVNKTYIILYMFLIIRQPVDKQQLL